MNDAIWIEIIKIVPALLWTGIGLAALLIARRLLAQQAHRLTRVESPFVSVDFAQDAIVQSFSRGPETAPPDASPQAADESAPASADGSPDEHALTDPARPQGVFSDADLDKTHQLRPLPPGTSAVRPPSYFAAASDPRLGLRAATRLANATAMLQDGAILWVDDHHQWNEPLVRLFRSAGMGVDLVGTTEEALHCLDQRVYDLVITDLRREQDPGEEYAGMTFLDRMIARGVPTPAVVFSDNPKVLAMSHPRAAATTNNPEDLVNEVVDMVGARRNAMNQQQAGTRGGFALGIR